MGVLNLNLMGRALLLRWLWMSQMDPSRSWVALPIKEDATTMAFFKASIRCTVGNGAGTRWGRTRQARPTGPCSLAHQSCWACDSYIASGPRVSINSLAGWSFRTDVGWWSDSRGMDCKLTTAGHEGGGSLLLLASFTNWWLVSRKRVIKRRRKVFDSLILLIARGIWLQRNNRVFDRRMVAPATLACELENECVQWCQAGLMCGSLVACARGERNKYAV
jgi:hypothetical protein